MTENETSYQVTLVVTFNEGGQMMPEYKEYSEKTTEIVKRNGGTPNKPFFIEKNAGNGSTPNAVFSIDFPSKEAAEKTFFSEEYKSLIPTREVAIKEKLILFPM